RSLLSVLFISNLPVFSGDFSPLNQRFISSVVIFTLLRGPFIFPTLTQRMIYHLPLSFFFQASIIFAYNRIVRRHPFPDYLFLPPVCIFCFILPFPVSCQFGIFLIIYLVI